MIQRDPKYYTTGYTGDDPYKAPFYLRSLIFDGPDGDFNTSLIKGFNRHIEGRDEFKSCRFFSDNIAGEKLPDKIVVINASHDNLPTSHETARIFQDYCREKGWNIPGIVVNTREELLSEVEGNPSGVLVASQCVDKNIYDVRTADELTSKGVVIVPGRITAPGSIFSDKNSTYELLSDGGRHWTSVARYVKVGTQDKTVEDVVNGIFEAIDDLEKDTGDSTFFVKPHEGGGGLGGFRITKRGGKYIIPDLSKVSGNISDIHPTFMDFDFENKNKLQELLWIYRLFSNDDKMESNYLWVDLPIEGADDRTAQEILKSYLKDTAEKRERKLASMVLDKKEAEDKLIESIRIFEKKFKRRYTPLVNEHLDFGLWGLRAHYRLSRKGPKLETMYSRIFQLAFTPEGIGYLGSDNISNKQTGDLEILRLGPVNEIMVQSIGGEEALFAALLKGAEALAMLADLVPEEERNRIPLRLQLDLAAPSRRIGEGNADTARGLCLASRWTEFVSNAREWLEDSLAYYAWKKMK